MPRFNKAVPELLCALLIMVIFFTFPLQANAVQTAASGSCGENLGWVLDADGTLTVSGTGAMDDYIYSKPPWSDRINMIKALIIEPGVSSIGYAAFENCVSLTGVTIADSVTSIGAYAFYGCSALTDIALPARLTVIGDNTFEGCTGIASITIPESVVTIGNEAFYRCTALTAVTLPGSLESIGSYAFANCTALSGISLPDSVSVIGNRAFFNCEKLSYIDLSDSLSAIDELAFFNCTALTTLRIPASVTRISNAAFAYCSALRYITFEGSVPAMDDNVFLSVRASGNYPFGNETWSDAGGFGGTIVWAPYYADAQKLSVQILNEQIYACGSTLAASDIQVSVLLRDGKTQILEQSQYTVENWDSKIPGRKEVTFRHGTFTASCTFVFHERATIPVVTSKYPQSDHDYANSSDETKTFTCPGALLLTLTFSDETSLAEGDQLYLYDKSGDLLVTLSGDSASGMVLYVPGDTFQIRLLSDEADTDYGYSFDSIQALMWIHDIVTDVAVPVTCTEDGLTEGRHCAVCDEATVPQQTIPARGHSWGQWEEIKPATDTENGQKQRACAVCNEIETEVIPAAGRINPFTDVTRGDQFEKAILWAYYGGITKGTSATEFSPERACTRKQIVTFLWRAAGCPEPESMENPFTDVTQGDQFEKAILWAFYAGITKGTSNTEFSPEQECTRKQIVTFLWRYHGSPEPESMENPFKDVTRGDQFEKAILWAYCRGVTKGTSGTEFSPEQACTRKQIVTFLYRDLTQ